MTDSKTATERLRELLDERGVEWKNVGGTTSADGMTEWLVDGMTCQVVNCVSFGIEHLALFIPVLTPEQAVAATLGTDTEMHDFCKRVENAAKAHRPLELFGVDYTATLGSGECENVASHWGEFECSECGFYADFGSDLHRVSLCPDCGKVVKR